MSYPRELKASALAGAVLLALAGCGGSGGGEPAAAPADTVPATAGESVQGFVAFSQGLDVSETDAPLNLSAFLPPTDDTAEPIALR